MRSKRPLSPREVLDAAQRAQPGLGLATVYRNLNAMVEDGWLVPVQLPGESARYERAGLDHHHHFHCTRCDRAFDIDAGRGTLKKRTAAGFTVTRQEIVLYGRCAECAAQGKA